MDGELLGYEHRLIHQHLQRCRTCNNDYEELLQTKRLLAAMRMREPSQRLAPAILQQLASQVDQEVVLGFGAFRVSLPASVSRPTVYSPIIGLGLGLTFFGVLFWTHPTSRADSAATGHRALVFEPADRSRDELPPHFGELTSGLMREGAPQPAALESTYPVDLPDFPHRVRRSRSNQSYFVPTTLLR